MGIEHLQNTGLLPTSDYALSGSGFVVYVLRVRIGVAIDQPSRSFIVAGHAGLPAVGELWQNFKDTRSRLTSKDVSSFLEALKMMGYVQIENLIQMEVGYE